MDLSVVVPCHDETAHLPRFVGRFREMLGGMRDFAVVLVNSGSNDLELRQRMHQQGSKQKQLLRYFHSDRQKRAGSFSWIENCKSALR